MAEFLVVKFLAENSVTVVPSSWVMDKEGDKVCAWPPYKSLTRLNNAVKNKEPPSSSWQLVAIAVMKNAESFEKGLEYEEKAMYTSDLATECEEVEGGKKKKKSNKRKKMDIGEYSSEEEIRRLPPYPKFSHKKNVQPSKVQSPQIPHSSPSFNDYQHSTYSPPMSQPSLFPMPSSFNDTPITSSFNNTPIPSSFKNAPMPSSFNNTQISSPLNSTTLQTSSYTPMHQTPTMPVRKIEESFQKKVLRLLEKMRQDIQDIKETINVQKNPLPQLPPGCPKLPCENPEDLADLEDVLKDESNFTSICNYLGTIGGTSMKDATKRVLQQIVSNKLSLKYNWKGTRGVKLGFGIFTSVTKLVLGSVRKNNKFSSVTEVEVNNVIKMWLMHAKDREGGRSERGILSPLSNI